VRRPPVHTGGAKDGTLSKDDFVAWMDTLDISDRDLSADFLRRSSAALRSQADLRRGPLVVKRRREVSGLYE
jgi:hypothetical protein